MQICQLLGVTEKAKMQDLTNGWDVIYAGKLMGKLHGWKSLSLGTEKQQKQGLRTRNKFNIRTAHMYIRTTYAHRSIGKMGEP